MSSILAPRPDDRPPQREDWGTGVTISVAAHLALIAALYWGMHWHSSSEPAEASAELWAAMPETQAPPPVVAPPPPPVETPPPPAPVETPKPPDIVIEKTPDKPKPKPTPPPPPKPAPPPPKPAPPPPPKDALDAKAREKLYQDNLKRMMGQLDAPPTATGTGARNAAPSAGYAGRIIARLKPNLRGLVDSIPGNPEAVVSITCSADGTIVSRKIIKSSGNKTWDEAVLRAVDATGVLPRDTDGRIPIPLELAWHPQD